MAPDQPSSYGQPAPLRQRATALLLAIAANVLLLILLLRLAPPAFLKPAERHQPVMIEVPPPAPISVVQAKTKRSSGGSPRRAIPTPHAPSPPATRPPAAQTAVPWMELSRNDFAAADISKLSAPQGDNAPASGTGGGSGAGDSSSDGPGSGPGGERLYNVEWYRRPTDAELDYYLPKRGVPEGWGMIACKTVAAYHVDDCVEIGESPAGSGLSRALRQAAWQFLVRPPRIGERRLIGSWVRIRVDFSEAKAR